MSFALYIVRRGKPGGRPLSCNHGFMSTVVEALRFAGVLDEKARPRGGVRWPPKGLRATKARLALLEEYAQLGEPPLRPPASAVEAEAIAAYRVADERVRSSPGAAGKVPLFKLESNDRWRVSPAESAVLADGLARVLDTKVEWETLCDVLDFDRRDSAAFAKEIRTLTAFARRAATAEGFEVS